MNEIVPACIEHAEALATRLRKSDVAEIKAASGQAPEEALVLSLALSPQSWVWLHNGKVMAMFGVAPYPGRSDVGIPWLLCAKGADRHKVYFVRQSIRYIRKMLESFSVLENYVDCRNTPSIQWLSWCGFALCEVVPFYGAQRLPFIRFAISRRPADV